MVDELTMRPYRESDERGWVACRVVAFLDSPFVDDVRKTKEIHEHPAIALAAERAGAIVGLIAKTPSRGMDEMQERNQQPHEPATYVKAARFDWLSLLYDLLVFALARERQWKPALVARPRLRNRHARRRDRPRRTKRHRRRTRRRRRSSLARAAKQPKRTSPWSLSTDWRRIRLCHPNELGLLFGE